jgi:hypothetical protein
VVISFQGPKFNDTSISNSCLLKWIEYLKARVRSNYLDNYHNMKLVCINGDNCTEISPPCGKNFACCRESDQEYCTDTTVFTVTTTSTLTKPATTECDHSPRAISTGETVITTLTSAADPNNFCLKQPRNKAEFERDQMAQPQDAPRCKISNVDCADSWKSFLEAFEYSITYDGFRMYEGNNPSERREFCLQSNGTCSCKISKPRQVYNLVMGSLWRWENHLFANCPDIMQQIRFRSLNEFMGRNLSRIDVTNLSGDVLDGILNDITGCEVMVSSFVLLYFRADIPQQRDICVSSGYGEFFSYRPVSSLTDPAVSAIETEIVFDQHDLRGGLDAISKKCIFIKFLTF